MKKLAAKNVQTRPVWHLNHRQKPYRKNQTYKIKKSYIFWRTILTIPSGSGLKRNEVRAVAGEIARLRNGEV